MKNEWIQLDYKIIKQTRGKDKVEVIYINPETKKYKKVVYEEE